MEVDGFTVSRAYDGRRDLFILHRSGAVGAGQAIGRYDTLAGAWQRAAEIAARDRASVMVPPAAGTSARLSRP